MFISTGILKYSENPFKLIVEIDQEIGLYYRSQLPKYIRCNRPLYPFHISVIRQKEPLNEFWCKYQSEEVEFVYDPIILSSDIYYWLGVSCDRLKQIRVELGLPELSWLTRSPDGDNEFHITIGNMKNL
jgi:hypothetical protein